MQTYALCEDRRVALLQHLLELLVSCRPTRCKRDRGVLSGITMTMMMREKQRGVARVLFDRVIVDFER